MNRRKKLDFIYCKSQKIIQTAYMLFAIIGTFGIIGNIEIGYKTPKTLLILYFISLFLTIAKILKASKK